MDIDLETDSDSSSEYEFGKVALAYDPNQLSGGNGPPSNGHDYLKLVEIERSKLPACTQAKRFKDSNNSSALPNNKTQPIDTEADLLFRDDILSNFLKLRNFIYSQRDKEEHDCDVLDASSETSNVSEQTRLVIKMTEPEVHSALDEVVDGDKTFDSEWIYSLLASLREPIDADTCSALRQIARLCQTRRKTNPKDLGSMLIICIVRNQFDQRDIKMI